MQLQFRVFVIAIFIFLLFLFMVLKVHKRSKTEKQSSKLPPGPWKLPLIGHIHHLLGLPHHSLRDLAKKHGPIMFLQLCEVPAVIVSSPRMAKLILKTNDIVFADRPPLLAAEILSYNYIGIIFSPYGEYWRQLRKICVLELLSAKKVQSMSLIRDEEVSNLIEKVSSLAGLPVNVTEMLTLLTNDITSRAAFGKKCKDKEAFLSLMQELLTLAGGFDFADLFPSLKFLHGISGTKLKLERIHRKLDIILQDILNDHEENRVSTATKKDEYEDLVDVLLRLQEDNDLAIPIVNNNIKAIILVSLSIRPCRFLPCSAFQLIVYFCEGYFYCWKWEFINCFGMAFSELMRNPRIMEKAQTEVRNVFKGKQKVDQSDLNELNYLGLVIKETLRLHPPAVLILPRESRERCEIDGYVIPKKTKVIVNAWAIARDPDIWENADRFEPERFQDISIDYSGTNFEYIPFGAGRRVCPGISFGIANIELPLAQLLYHFDWKLPGGLMPKELDMTEVFGASVNRKFNLNLVPTLYS